jgi:putative ABC transport system permease protein
MLIKISWRNIWRSKKRSLIIIAAVIIGLWAGIFLIAFYNGMIEQRIRTAITQETSHLQIHDAHFKEDYDPQYILQNGSTLLQQIKSNENVKAASGRIIVTGMISSPSGSSGIMINGVTPEDEQSLTGLQDKIIQGNYFNSGKANQTLISDRLIKKLKLNLGNKTILTFQDKEGNLASSAFKICGIYKTVNSPYDEKNVFVKIQDVDSLVGITGHFHEIAILLQSNKLLDESQKQLKNQHPDLLIENWMEISPELGLTASVSDQMVYIYMGIILLALAFGIINTMMMSVLERTREIGMLMALGMNKVKVFSMIILETLFLVFIGTPLGIILALITIKISYDNGINFKAYEEVYSNFGYSDTIYPVLTLKHFFMIIELVVITALLSGLFPARRALKLKPVESIRK